MAGQLWDSRRSKLVETVRKASLDLLGHSNNAAGFKVDLGPPHEKLFVVAGDRETIRKLVG